MLGLSDCVLVDLLVFDKLVEVIVIRDSSVLGDIFDFCEDFECNDFVGNGLRR